ncbi:MAG: hypothetical protein SNI49_07625 [Rikenellaceae bacterium]
MKRLFSAAVAILITVFSANAQVKIVSPHPDLEVKVTRCACANGTLIIDLLITNYGETEDINICANDVKLYDDEGNQYNSQSNKILMGFPNQGLHTKENCVGPSYELPQDVPLKYRFQIDGVKSSASKIVLFSAGFHSREALSLDSKKPLQIRNLEWVK